MAHFLHYVQPGTFLAYILMGGFNVSTVEVIRKRIVVREKSGIRRIVGYVEGNERFFPEAFVPGPVVEVPERDKPRYILYQEAP
jgi:hypothetical protein